jgi:hypothetical protein
LFCKSGGSYDFYKSHAAFAWPVSFGFEGVTIADMYCTIYR